jgi:hypothetical protein
LAVPFRKRETVAADTPATRATSWTVTIDELLESFFMRLGLLHARLCREGREYTPGHACLTWAAHCGQKIYLTPGQASMYDEIDFKNSEQMRPKGAHRQSAPRIASDSTTTTSAP